MENSDGEFRFNDNQRVEMWWSQKYVLPKFLNVVDAQPWILYQNVLSYTYRTNFSQGKIMDLPDSI